MFVTHLNACNKLNLIRFLDSKGGVVHVELMRLNKQSQVSRNVTCSIVDFTFQLLTTPSLGCYKLIVLSVLGPDVKYFLLITLFNNISVTLITFFSRYPSAGGQPSLLISGNQKVN